MGELKNLGLDSLPTCYMGSKSINESHRAYDCVHAAKEAGRMVAPMTIELAVALRIPRAYLLVRVANVIPIITAAAWPTKYAVHMRGPASK